MEKMLAVRLPRDLVDEVKHCANIDHKSLKAFVGELLALELAQVNSNAEIKITFEPEKLRGLFKNYREAVRNGQVLSSLDKKMLAVRVAPQLMEALGNRAIDRKKNISLIVEEFIHLGLARRRGETIDTKTMANLTSKSSSPYRRRKKQNQSEECIVEPSRM